MVNLDEVRVMPEGVHTCYDSIISQFMDYSQTVQTSLVINSWPVFQSLTWKQNHVITIILQVELFLRIKIVNIPVIMVPFPLFKQHCIVPKDDSGETVVHPYEVHM